jgi:hypothetical protein
VSGSSRLESGVQGASVAARGLRFRAAFQGRLSSSRAITIR